MREKKQENRALLAMVFEMVDEHFSAFGALSLPQRPIAGDILFVSCSGVSLDLQKI